MSNGGMDGFDWLQNFLPADSQPDHDPNSNNEAYRTHPAFHDAEEVARARATVMHQQAHNSYSFVRTTNHGTNHALNPPHVYSQASGGQYEGNRHQQTSNTQFNNLSSGHSAHPKARSHNINHQPNPPIPSQKHLNAQPREGTAPYPRMISNSTPNYPDVYQSTRGAHETARSTVAVQRTNQPMARPVPTSQGSYQGYSATLNQNSQMSTQPYMEQGMTTQVQRTRTPAISQSNSYTRSSHIPPGPSLHSQDHVQSTVPTAPHRVHSTATSQPASTHSPSVSLVSSAPTSATAPPAPLTKTTIVPHQIDKGWTQEKEGPQGNVAPTSSYQAPNQESQQPHISQPNGQSPPVVPSAYASPTPSAASHLGPSYNASHTSGPRLGTLSNSTVTQQPAVVNTQSQDFPLSGPLHHEKKRVIPTEENSMPLAKVRLLDNGKSQTMTLQNNPSASSSVPGAKGSTEYTRPRGSGKFLKNRGDLVQPIRWSDALPKVSYDPATIARDVLIAAGRHPTEKHLNHHLEPLRRNFTKIDYLANLATFRWDLVDAKQPETQVDRVPLVHAPHMPPLQSPHPQPPHAQPPLAARHSVARDPYVTANHVTTRDQAPLPPRETPPKRQIAMPERIDARAPPSGLSPWGTLPFKPPTYHSPQRIFSSSTLPSGLPRIDPVPASPKFSSHESVPTPPPPQPRARPQQRRPSATNSPAPPKPPPAAKQPTPKSTKSPTKPKPQGQTVKSTPDSGRTVKSPEAKRLPQPLVVIPISSVKMTTKRRPGRPSKNVVANIEVAIHREQPVHYPIFPCKWEECTAELHNIESVRAHLIKVHIPHSLVCKWTDCGNKTPMAAADMFTHLSSEHVSKMAWELGDGPTVPVTGENYN